MLIACPLLCLAINSFADLHRYDDTVARSSKHLFHLPPFFKCLSFKYIKKYCLELCRLIARTPRRDTGTIASPRSRWECRVCPLFPKQRVEADNSAGVDGQDSFLAAPIVLLSVWWVYLMLLLPIKAACSRKEAPVCLSHSLGHGANPCSLVFSSLFY